MIKIDKDSTVRARARASSNTCMILEPRVHFSVDKTV